jgi:hypothetical protein
MWYRGADGANGRIGYAASQDGISWTKYYSNPILTLGNPGTWDDYSLLVSKVMRDDTNLRMWYAGSDGSNERIGTASADYADSGYLESAILDAGFNSAWISINWTEFIPVGTNITLATRSGNTSTPDASWSPWSPEMWDETGTSIVSPASKYLQFRATLTTTDRNVTSILSDVTINYILADPNPPTITDLSADPDPQYSGGFVNISARVTDDIGLDEVRVSIAGVGNYSMNYDSISDLYYYNASFSDHGTYSYAIWARDTSDNWNSESSYFTILEPQDEEPVDDWWWIILVIIIIILVMIILLLLMRRRKKKEEEETALPPPLPPPPPTP